MYTYLRDLDLQEMLLESLASLILFPKNVDIFHLLFKIAVSTFLQPFLTKHIKKLRNWVRKGKNKHFHFN
jgi:hypothetical protein